MARYTIHYIIADMETEKDEVIRKLKQARRIIVPYDTAEKAQAQLDRYRQAYSPETAVGRTESGRTQYQKYMRCRILPIEIGEPLPDP